MATMKKILVLLCIVTLVSSFNSDRLLDEEQKVAEKLDENKRDERSADFSHDHNEHKYGNHRRGGKRRHIRNRRDELPEDVRGIFDFPETLLQQQVQPMRRSVQSDWYNQMQNYIRATPYNNQQGYSQSPPAYHNTIVPNGPQVNNYYPQYSNTPYSGGWNPYGNQPGQIIYAPIIFVPFPFCYPQPASQNPMNVSETDVNNRFGFEDEKTGNNGMSDERPINPNVNIDEYFKPIQGISLEPVAPLRPPSRPAPPIQHGSSNTNSNTNQNSAPYPAPRPESSFVSGNSASSNNQFVRPTQRPSRPRPITTLRPSFAASNLDNNYSEPSSCVKAIVSCCLGGSSSRDERDRCFERNSCGGAFWDSDPCDSSLAKAAEQTVLEFRTRGNFGK